MNRRRMLVLAAVLVVLAASGAVRLINLGRPSSYIFDEVYYAHDAKVIVDGQLGPKLATLSWEPGKEISWPHPEYGKLAIALGILGFGNNSFGWRFVPALAGIALLCFVFPIARRFGLNRGWALAALVLASADMLGIVQSRIGTLDIFVGLWTVACVYLALRYVQDGHRWYWLLLCGLAGGLALGTKWSGGLALLVALVLVALFRKRRPLEDGAAADAAAPSETHMAPSEAVAAESEAAARTVEASLVDPETTTIMGEQAAPEPEAGSEPASAWLPPGERVARAARAAILPILLLIVLPAGLYVASYSFYFAAGHSWGDWWQMQQQALNFNLNLKATHTYASPSPSWILDARPVWYYYQGSKTVVHGVVALGNPLLWWSATLALLVLPAMAIGDRDRRLAMPALVVALLYFPWFAATRTSFLYYMTPVAPFMAVMVATVLQRLTGERQRWPRLRVAEELPGEPGGNARNYLAGLCFVFAGLITALFWRPIGQGAAELFWRGPQRVSPSLSYAVVGIVAALSFCLVAWITLRVRGLSVWRALGWGYVGIVAGLGVAFLPIIVDIAISPAAYYRLMWLPSWI